MTEKLLKSENRIIFNLVSTITKALWLHSQTMKTLSTPLQRMCTMAQTQTDSLGPPQWHHNIYHKPLYPTTTTTTTTTTTWHSGFNTNIFMIIHSSTKKTSVQKIFDTIQQNLWVSKWKHFTSLTPTCWHT